jgi:SagB-type dehydrogenase family enzyme
MGDAAESLATVLAYHERTKHLPGRFARSLGHMDWATQPDPFRRFAGAPVLYLDLVRLEDQPRYELAFFLGNVPPVPLGRRWASQLFHDSLALSAWKQAGAARWSLRVNPSSGNLHPTEGYLIAGPIDGLTDKPAVYHYAPHEHALERRADLSDETWAALAAQLPPGSVLVGLTSIHWRESWKYGERGFRYCQHDVGHAMAAVAVAAAGLGWEARLCEGVTDSDLARLLGVDSQTGPEAEDADCLLALSPQGAALSIEQQQAFTLSDAALTELGIAQRSGSRTELDAFPGSPIRIDSRPAQTHGVPNRLSPDHGQHWPVIDEVAGATRKTEPPIAAFWHTPTLVNHSLAAGNSPLALRPIIAQRRSAVALDGHTGLSREAFFQILLKTIPGKGQVPFTTLPWRPRIDLLLFVHRVEGVPPGLYALLRDPARKETLVRLMTPGFAWTSPEGCPTSLPLFLLEAGDARRVAAQTSCGQDIAADGVFAAAMLAEYRAPLETFGAWFYRRLHWEAGVVGQQLYLEAEASGIRATGIGCFFDDVSHRTFELPGDGFQVLYHFTMGGAIDDVRLQTVPPYPHLAQ